LYSSFVRERTSSSYPAFYTIAFPTSSFIILQCWTIFICYTRTKKMWKSGITYY